MGEAKSTWRDRAPEIQRMLDAGKTYGEIAKHYGTTRKNARNRIAELRLQGLIRTSSAKPADEPRDPAEKAYRASVEIRSDGTHKSDKLLRMSEEQSKDVDYLLQAHGYDKDAWTLVSARNNIWNTYSKQDGIQTLYASQIVVKPRTSGWTFDELLEEIRKVEPVTVQVPEIQTDDRRMLEIPLFDAHFGISDHEYYQPTQQKILSLITSRRWAETLFVIGQDMLHNDNFRGQTANGTVIEAVDVPKAWADCRRFYEPMIVAALRHSDRVKIMYAKGNHDESMSWAFVQYLKARFPQAAVDDEVQERKVHVFGANFLGITHGDKGRKHLASVFPAEFPLEWARTKNREIHTGHYHAEDSKDGPGIMIRTLSTRNKTDQWHRDHGFVGTHKRFMLFEWSESALEAIHYV